MHKEGICYLDKRGAIAVFVDVGSSSSRWFRKREGRSRVFCFPTKEMNHEERLGKSPFTGLPNVKGTVQRMRGSRIRRRVPNPCSRSGCVHVRVCSDAPDAEGGAAGMTRAAACGVVVASVPWAEPGSRSTRDFESERAWPMSVANQKTVSGFPHVAWRAAGRRRP